MIEELGSILVYAGRPMPNKAGDKLTFLQYRTIGSRTNDSWGLYLQDVADGKLQLIDELSTATWEESWVYDQVRTFGWSPDDQFFAYARNGMKEVVLYDVVAGKCAGTFLATKPFTSGDWLSAKKLACTDGEQIFEIEKVGDVWQGLRVFASSEGGLKGVSTGKSPIETIQTFSSNSLLWRQGSTLCRSIAGDFSEQLWQMPTNELVDFHINKETGKILLHGREHGRNKRGDFLAELEAKSSPDQFAMTSPEWIEFTAYTGYRASQLRSINGGLGCSYLHVSGDMLNTLTVQMHRGDAPVQLPLRGEIKSFAVNGQKLFVMGAMTNEPVGLWKYDLVSGELDQLSSNQRQDFQYASSQPALVSRTKERSLTYYLLRPARLDPKRLPPLVLGIMGIGEKAYVWDRYAQTIANCGYYFVTVDRRGRAEHEWGEDARIVHEALTKAIKFDTNNTYLLGISVGAPPVNQLLRDNPALWRGAIFLSPGSLPETTCLYTKRLFVDIGGLDPIWGANSVRAKEFQDRAARGGADMRLFIRPNVGHNCRLLSVEKERLHQLAAFLDDAD
jgi:dienelactone hydrolase